LGAFGVKALKVSVEPEPVGPTVKLLTTGRSRRRRPRSSTSSMRPLPRQRKRPVGYDALVCPYCYRM